jgi:hypothetical protein
MTKAGLSPTRLRRKVLALCAEANYVGDLISELADEARDQQKVLLLSRDEPTESPSKRLAPRSLATSSRLMRARRTDDVTLTLQPSVCPRPRRAMMHDSAPRLVTTADLGARLAAVNWFAVKAVLGVLVRSLQSAKSPTGASDDSERTRDQRAPGRSRTGDPVGAQRLRPRPPPPAGAALTQPLASPNSISVWVRYAHADARSLIRFQRFRNHTMTKILRWS